MASTSKIYLNLYYYELCDRILVLGVNLKEHMVGAIHRGLLEALMKITKHQL
jgi:hypothetical protein